MRKTLFFFAGGAALFLIACLVAPGEPTGTSNNALSCAAGLRAFNGACRAVCTSSSACAAGTHCMNVGSAGVALCLDYTHCAYLGSDTQCSGANSGYASYATSYNSYGYGWDFGYGSYAYGGSYGGSSYGGSSSSSFYGYGGEATTAGCAGNATWQTLPAGVGGGDPQCGAPHVVTRCAHVAGTCAFVAGTTSDVADP